MSEGIGQWIHAFDKDSEIIWFVHLKRIGHSPMYCYCNVRLHKARQRLFVMMIQTIHDPCHPNARHLACIPCNLYRLNLLFPILSLSISLIPSPCIGLLKAVQVPFSEPYSDSTWQLVWQPLPRERWRVPVGRSGGLRESRQQANTHARPDSWPCLTV